MKRFILLAFGVLALAFFELSGGANFDPAETRQASLEIRQQLEAERHHSAQSRIAALPRVTGPAPLSADQIVQAEGVGSTKLNLASFQSADSPEASSLPMITSEAVEDPAPLSEDKSPADLSLTAPAIIEVAPTTSVKRETSGISFAGLSASASSSNVTLPDNLRIISGSRVNLRAGPGTGFEVLDQLNADTRVEILEDAGNGWVQLRPVDGGQTGWIADFLLADG
jgi:hypothetical protein